MLINIHDDILFKDFNVGNNDFFNHFCVIFSVIYLESHFFTNFFIKSFN